MKILSLIYRTIRLLIGKACLWVISKFMGEEM